MFGSVLPFPSTSTFRRTGLKDQGNVRFRRPQNKMKNKHPGGYVLPETPVVLIRIRRVENTARFLGRGVQKVPLRPLVLVKEFTVRLESWMFVRHCR